MAWGKIKKLYLNCALFRELLQKYFVAYLLLCPLPSFVLQLYFTGGIVFSFFTVSSEKSEC